MIYKIKNNLYVRDFEKKDVKIKYKNWFEDQIITNYSSHGKFSRTKKYFQDYIENYLNTNDRILWAICYKSRHIGNLTLSNISLINRSAEFSIIIGDKKFWKKNIGYFVLKKLFEHTFNKLNINRIYCGTSSKNTGMINLAIKLGMKKEGVRRQALYINNEYTDQIDFSILKREFKVK